MPLQCRKCGSKRLAVMPNKKNPKATDLYCSDCGAWQKFATKDEIRLYQSAVPNRTKADQIRQMSDEELALLLWKAGRNYRQLMTRPHEDWEAYKKLLLEELQSPVEKETVLL